MMAMFRIISCVFVEKRVFAMISMFSWQNSISLCPASFCTSRTNLPVTAGISWFPTFVFQYLVMKRTSFFDVSYRRSCRSSSVQLSRSVVSDSAQPQRQQPTRLPRPWDSPGKNTGVGCHFLLQCMKVKSENEVAQSCQTQRPHGLQPIKLLRPWDFPGKSTGVGCHCFLR